MVVANAHGSASSNENVHHLVVVPSAVRKCNNMKCKCELMCVTIAIERGMVYFWKSIEWIH
jgi:hypothetical protein